MTFEEIYRLIQQTKCERWFGDSTNLYLTVRALRIMLDTNFHLSDEELKKLQDEMYDFD